MLDLLESPIHTRIVPVVETPGAFTTPEPWQERLNAMDHWTASLVHDLRNPLAAICGSAEMLLGASLAPPDAMRVTSNIHRAARRMGELLADFACFTRGHAEAIERCNLRAILATACEASGLAERDGIELLLDVPARIEIPLARARMQRVFPNLIVNALDAMPDGGAIRITASEVRDRVLIEVEDSGAGIPAEIRHRLFEPFVTFGKKDGLGLGLTLSRQTVRHLGGDLWAEPAAGARFVISLPLQAHRVSPPVESTASSGCHGLQRRASRPPQA